MDRKLFPWMARPLFSSGVMDLRSDGRIKRQIIIGPASDGGEIACYRADDDFGGQEKTYLITSLDAEILLRTYEKALQDAEYEGYILQDPDRPTLEDVQTALQEVGKDARDS